MHNKKIRLPIILALVYVVITIVWFFLSNKNQYGDELQIKDLSQYTNGKATNEERLAFIRHNLFSTVNLNTKPAVKSNSIQDIEIRKDSFSQTFDKENSIYMVHFIVDIASLKQSYRVAYQWTTDKTKEGSVAEYGTQVSCLPIDELIYGSFNCVDERIVEKGVNEYDPVGAILPYHVEGRFEVKTYQKATTEENDNPTSDMRTILGVYAYIPRWMDKPDEKLLAEYTKEIRAWLSSRKLNPDNYAINFIY
jgi:hypothetical protein